MIIKASQYGNLKPRDIVKNKVRSINTKLKQVFVIDGAEVASYNNVFTLPEEVQKSRYSFSSEPIPNPYLINVHQRGESKFISIDEEYSFVNPTTVSHMEITYKTTTKITEPGAVIFNPASAGFDIPILSSSNSPIRTLSEDFFEAWEDPGTLYNSCYSITENQNVLPSTGNVGIYASKSSYIWVPSGNTIPLNFVSESSYKIRLTGNVPYYSMAIEVESEDLNNPNKNKRVAIQESLMTEMQIKFIARTAEIEEIQYKSSEESPSKEIVTNELLQLNATMTDSYYYNIVEIETIKDGINYYYRARTTKPVTSKITVTLLLTLKQITLTINVGETHSAYVVGNAIKTIWGSTITPTHDSNYIYSGKYEGSDFTVGVIDYIRDKIIRAQRDGRITVSFDLYDTEVILSVGDLIKLEDVFGELYKNGMEFFIYSIEKRGINTQTRTISALEVK